jgi:hypothetical protein
MTNARRSARTTEGSWKEAPCCTGQSCRRTEPYPCFGSCGADVLRASKVQHAVQHIGSDGHLGRLTPVRPRAQPVADDAFSARDVGLHKSAPTVPRGLLPAHPAALGDASQMRVPLRRRGLGRVAWHRARARRHDNGRIRVPRRNRGVHIVPIEGTVADEGRDRPIHLVEQGTDLRAIRCTISFWSRATLPKQAYLDHLPQSVAA